MDCGLPYDAQHGIADFLAQLKPGAPPSTNQGTRDVAFQRWFKFKEAFSPAFVRDIVEALPSRPQSCCDPFGGSGTTALTCQFLGIAPATIELNPFLADLIEAKLVDYDVEALRRDRRLIADRADQMSPDLRNEYIDAPPTLFEPGVRGKWVFDERVLMRIAQHRLAIQSIETAHHARLFLVLLGSVLVHLSNVVVNGKGRRYRGGWERLNRGTHDVDAAFDNAFQQAIVDIERVNRRSCKEYTLVRGDARIELRRLEKQFDLVLFSPPYLNSFDYTDIYNIELWVLGYLRTRDQNTSLRGSTIASHVQIKRSYEPAPETSALLQAAISKIESRRHELWNRYIPDMIGSYFRDLEGVLYDGGQRLSTNGRIAVVVADSQYAGVTIPVAQILAQLAPSLDLRVEKIESMRPIRASAQQGGDHRLSEELIWFRRAEL